MPKFDMEYTIQVEADNADEARGMIAEALNPLTSDYDCIDWTETQKEEEDDEND